MASIESGVSKMLADERKANISNVRYDLFFDIPKVIDQSIEGKNGIAFELKNTDADVLLDFQNDKAAVKKVIVNQTEIEPQVVAEHIIIPNAHLIKGSNSVVIDFTAGEKALNRNEDFLYTLFVPDNARSAFPCFDQPNIKAKYTLSLRVPKDWEVCANYPLKTSKGDGNHTYHNYKPTPPISTYLFAFAAGKFQKITEIINGRSMTMYHRETDEEKVKNNAFTVFDLHAKSLDWLEKYTGIPLPFEKFDFVLIPAFQFGGMEHPGAIFYKQRSLFLDENATVNQKMSRNSLIAHETAHMWFGDLVTMDWFNDVWLKEVFANFMAAKMVNPNFPEINHDLRFLARHQPTAYGEDRTAGTHPIQQVLDNLNQASLMYGRIIYQKAPVVMNQLEEMTGEEKFREGMRGYLQKYAFDNATWDDLITILDQRIDLDLKQWSRAWVKESGMPHIQADLQTANGKITTYDLSTKNTTSGGSIWSQNAELVFSNSQKIERQILLIDAPENRVGALIGKAVPNFILPNASSNGYGFFELD
ncbi:MAG: M1 family aminopeptidase, partial [Bacteroidota bacterium]